MSDSMRCRGMRDTMPAEMALARRLEQAFRDVCLGWGYGEIRTPTIEHLHLFTAAGALSPQMLGRVYSFLDWDGWTGERVVLRPESTIPTARLYVEQFPAGEVARLFYIQNVLRFAEGDASREDWQCGVELIGASHPSGDLEIILLACEVLQKLGVGADLKLSDPAILRTILSKAGFDKTEQLSLYDRLLDGDETALDEAEARLPGRAAPLRALLSVEGEGTGYLSNLRSALLPAVPEIGPALDELTAVSKVLGEMDVRHRIAPALVRNFEYYTGPVFHLYGSGQKLGNGGRYDALVSLVGGENTPAAGFALDVDAILPRLAIAPSEEEQTVYVRSGGAGGPDLAAVFKLARTLRAAGVRVEMTGRRAGSRVEVEASAGGFVLRVNGTEPQQLSGVDEVVRAVAESTRA